MVDVNKFKDFVLASNYNCVIFNNYEDYEQACKILNIRLIFSSDKFYKSIAIYFNKGSNTQYSGIDWAYAPDDGKHYLLSNWEDFIIEENPIYEIW